jgi:cytochrome c peroxidase
MTRSPNLSVIAAILAGAALAGLAATSFAQKADTNWPSLGTIAPPRTPKDNPLTPAKAELGRRLFYDGDLSWDGTIACATCHEQKRGFADPNKTRVGFDGKLGERNIQALANIAYFNSLTWGGPHVDTLEHQALVPIEGLVPVEMGFSGRPEGALANRLRDQACYPQMFAAAFPEKNGEISMDTITMALAAFQRTLVSLDAPYDRYRRGEKSAISQQARRGEALFNSKECSSCHAGPHFTDAALPGVKPVEAFHALSPPKAGDQPAKDTGLARITLKPADAGRFRTPGLRNVSLSAPYMHDGEVASLPEAIRYHYTVAERQSDKRLKQKLSEAQVLDLVAFLDTLTDQGFITNPAFSLPKPGCPLPASPAKLADDASNANLHNNLPGP